MTSTGNDYTSYGPGYKGFVVKDGYFVPKSPDPVNDDAPFTKMTKVRGGQTRDIAFDDTYPYLDDSFKYKLNKTVCYSLLWALASLVNRVRYGVRIEGRSNVTKNRKLFKGGAMTICNHVFRWDMICVLQAVRFRTIRIPMFSLPFTGKDSWFMTSIGGIPIPEDRSGLRCFNEALDEMHRRGDWFHIFPESCSWKFYAPIRPFKIGAFNIAYKYNLPIIPCAISYRKRKGIFKLFGDASEPLITIHVGEPIIPDTTANRKTETARLREIAHAKMMSMAGIVSNPWPAAID